MKKIFIEDARVESFLSELRARLEVTLKDASNRGISRVVIIGVGESGTSVVSKLFPPDFKFDGITQQFEEISAQKVGRDISLINKTGGTLTLEGITPDTFGENTAFLVIDGVCRTGKTLADVYAGMRKISKRVWTYAVAVSSDSVIIPTWYGCLYQAGEFIVFTRNGQTPNTALYEKRVPGSKAQLLSPSPALVLRPPLKGDPDFHVGTALSINRYTTDDRFFDSTTRSKSILVLEWNSEPVGFIAFHVDGATLWIDYIVACQKLKNGRPGIGTALYYHVENYAKLRGCENISLWAIHDQVEWYKNRGFGTVAGSREIKIGAGAQEESYFPMTHRLISDVGQYYL